MRKVTDNFGLIVRLTAIVIFCSACGSKGASVKTDSAAIEAPLSDTEEPVRESELSTTDDITADNNLPVTEQKSLYEEDYEYLWGI